MNHPKKQKAEAIADSFSEISNLYQPLKSEDIKMPSLDHFKPAPLFEPYQIYEKMKTIKKNSFTVLGNIPWKIIDDFAVEKFTPLSKVYNSSTLAGV